MRQQQALTLICYLQDNLLKIKHFILNIKHGVLSVLGLIIETELSQKNPYHLPDKKLNFFLRIRVPEKTFL